MLSAVGTDIRTFSAQAQHPAAGRTVSNCVIQLLRCNECFVFFYSNAQEGELQGQGGRNFKEQNRIAALADNAQHFSNTLMEDGLPVPAVHSTYIGAQSAHRRRIQGTGWSCDAVLNHCEYL